MRTLGLAAALILLLSGCMTIHGYAVRESRSAETGRVGEILDPLLVALDMPSLRTIAASRGCKIGFAIVRTSRVNVWSSPGTRAPCLYFSLFLTEGALAAPDDELTAMIAHELGHLMLRHTPQPARGLAVSDAAWGDIQRQELEADRFAVAVLKQLRASSGVGSCEAVGRFLRRGVADWYGDGISARMEAAVNERAESADAACASAEAAPFVRVTPVSLAP
jgi:Zn-dependent protease with chaperone function